MEFFGSIKSINNDVFMIDTSDYEFYFPTINEKKLKIGETVRIDASKQTNIFGDYFYLVKTCRRHNVQKS